MLRHARDMRPLCAPFAQTLTDHVAMSSLAAVRAKYLLGIPLTADDLAAAVDQDAFVEQVLLHDVAVRFPPRASSRKRALRAIIDAVESRLEEVNDTLYSAYIELVAQPTDADAFRTVTLQHDPFVGVSTPDTGAMISHGTTGLSLWTAGYALADLLIQQRDWVRGRRVVELGAGLGLAGMAAAYAGAQSVVLTDGHDKVFEALGRAVELNRPFACPVSAAWLDWAHFDKPRDIDADILIGADLVFEENMVRQLALTLASWLPSVPHGALIASTRRRDETYAFFLSLACDNGLRVEELPVPAGLGDRFFCTPEAPIALAHITAAL